MKIGAQLYTLRDFCQTEGDLACSLEKIAKMGYTTVQVSGIGKIDPLRLRELCDENGLSIVLTHNDPNRIINDTDRLIEEHNILGCDYIGLGAMPPKYQNFFWVEHFTRDFREPAKKIAAAGKLLMYHNHNLEWTRLRDGRRIMDVLLEQMPADLMGVTLDTYWVQAAGADVLEWIDILQDRIPCVHLKDMSVNGFDQRKAVVGEGNLNFPKILEKLQTLGKTKYMLVEQDDCYGESAFDCLKRSYDNVRKMGY